MENRTTLTFLKASTAQLLFALLVITNCGGAPEKKKASNMTIERTSSGLGYQKLKSGNGKKAVKGKHAVVHYTGWLNDGNNGKGAKFDSSLTRGEPFEFPLGAGYVIKGWDEGVALMSEGDEMRFFIPAQLGYGRQGAGRLIPPDADLIFDVQLIEVR